MYRCKDCGTEYKKQVEYCNCGNNTFEIVPDEVIKKSSSKTFKSLTIENKISWLIFLLCVILSFIILLFPVKNQKTSSPKPVKITTSQKNIPDIEVLWNSTPAMPPKPVNKPQDEVIRPVEIKQIAEEVKKIIPVKKAETKVVKKPSTPVKTVQKPKSTAPAKPVQKPVAKPKTVQKPAPVPKTTTSKPVVQNNNKFNTDPVILKPQQSKNNSLALMTYKTELLNKLFSRFVVSSIRGGGSCVVSFNIASDGKLTNRKFVNQSSNKSLNDAVYYMLMSVPKFNPPPASYNGETLKIQFSYDNGEYEFSYL